MNRELANTTLFPPLPSVQVALCLTRSASRVRVVTPSFLQSTSEQRAVTGRPGSECDISCAHMSRGRKGVLFAFARRCREPLKPCLSPEVCLATLSLPSTPASELAWRLQSPAIFGGWSREALRCLDKHPSPSIIANYRVAVLTDSKQSTHFSEAI